MGYNSDFFIETIPPTEGVWVYRDGSPVPCEFGVTSPRGFLDLGGWKWYSYHEDLVAASLEYPDIVIQLDRDGEETDDIERCWYSNGRCIRWCPTIKAPEFETDMFSGLDTERVDMKPGFTYYPRKETTE